MGNYRQTASMSNAMRKRADGGVMNDTIGNMTSQMYLPYLGPLTSLGGSIAGLISGKPTEDEIAEMDKHPGRSYIPGVGAYRMTRKYMDTMNTPKARRRMAAEVFGGLTSSALLALALGGAGMAVGGMTGGNKGAAAGLAAGGAAGVLGGMAANTIGSMVGLARRRRTDEEQAQADTEDSNLASWLLPGVAGYRNARRLPSLTRREDERNREQQKKREAEKKED